LLASVKEKKPTRRPVLLKFMTASFKPDVRTIKLEMQA
jgi:hypothetical protein